VASESSYPSKITQPSAKRILVRKPLLQSIDKAQSDSPLIWISAPGGSGKSSLINSYITEYSRRHIWYQIDDGDSDLANLFHYLGLGAQKLSPHSKKTFPTLTAEYLPGISDFTRRFFNNIASILKTDGVIVFDNANLLADDHPFFSLLPVMVNALRPGQSIIMVSRRAPVESLISLQASRLLTHIPANLLRFNVNEWLQLPPLLGNNSLNETDLLKLHQQSDGWIAALVLATMDGSSPWTGNTTSISSSFTYFAHEVFNNLSSKHQQILLSHAYLHYITTQSSSRVCSNADGIALMTEMSQHNHFVTVDHRQRFTFHPLFQEFLQHESSQQLSSEDVKALIHLSAEALNNEGSHLEAIVFFQKSGDFSQAISLLCSHSDTILAMGQYERINAIISSIPESELAPYAQIWFIKGALSSMTDPKGSIEHYLRASELFKNDGLIALSYDALICAIKQVTTALQCFEELDRLLILFSEQQSLYPIPDEVSQKDLINTLMMAYFISDYDRKQMIYWIQRCEQEIEINPDPATATELTLALLGIYYNECNIDKIEKAINYVQGKLDKKRLPPFIFLVSHFNIILSWLHAGDIEEGYQLILSLKSYAQECEITALDSFFLIIESKFEFFRGNYQVVADNLSVLYPLCRGDKNYLSNYYYLQTQHLIWSDDLSGALDTIVQATQVLGDVNPFAWRIVLDDARAELLYWNGDYAASKALAEKLADEVETFPNRGIYIHSLMLLALIHVEQNNIEAVTEFLDRAFLQIKRHKIKKFSNWYPDFIYKVILLALKHNIQNTIVRDWAAQHLDHLSSPPHSELQWPWPIRIYTLGKFDIQVNGQSLLSSVRSDARSLQMMKTIVLHGGKISISELNEQMYSQHNANKQKTLLDTHLHRLRQLLNSSTAIFRDNEQLSLDPKQCWCDNIAFLEILSTSEANKNQPEQRPLALNLYKGEYLPDENDNYNVLTHREQLRGQYLIAVVEEITNPHLDAQQAIELLHQAIGIEPLSETLYQLLINFYLQQGHPHLAKATYEQCHRVFKAGLDIEPSEVTLKPLD